mgnify:CR=1 FL=1|jgi:hypothetical protein|tara:strand:- start:3235 stop:3465 length:231 start_codon:yes stop_codon:yes gene_type:complete
MSEQIRLERTESGGMITYIPVGKVMYSLDEYKNLELDRNNWKQIAIDLVEANYEQDARQLNKAVANFEGYNWSANG